MATGAPQLALSARSSSEHVAQPFAKASTARTTMTVCLIIDPRGTNQERRWASSAASVNATTVPASVGCAVQAAPRSSSLASWRPSVDVCTYASLGARIVLAWRPDCHTASTSTAAAAVRFIWWATWPGAGCAYRIVIDSSILQWRCSSRCARGGQASVETLRRSRYAFLRDTRPARAMDDAARLRQAPRARRGGRRGQLPVLGRGPPDVRRGGRRGGQRRGGEGVRRPHEVRA